MPQPYGMLYVAQMFGSNCATVPRTVLLPVDPAMLSGITVADLMVHMWFGPHRPRTRDVLRVVSWTTTKLTAFHDTALRRPFTVYTLRSRSTSTPVNAPLLRLSRGSCTWYGDVIVVKHGRRHSGDAPSNVASGDFELIVLLVIE